MLTAIGIIMILLYKNIFIPDIQSKNNILWKFDGQKVSGSTINSILFNNGHYIFSDSLTKSQK